MGTLWLLGVNMSKEMTRPKLLNATKKGPTQKSVARFRMRSVKTNANCMVAKWMRNMREKGPARPPT